MSVSKFFNIDTSCSALCVFKDSNSSANDFAKTYVLYVHMMADRGILSGTILQCLRNRRRFSKTRYQNVQIVLQSKEKKTRACLSPHDETRVNSYTFATRASLAFGSLEE